MTFTTQKTEIQLTDTQIFYVCCFMLGNYYSEDSKKSEEFKAHCLAQIKILYKLATPETRKMIKDVEIKHTKNKEQAIVDFIDILENELIKITNPNNETHD